MKSLLPEPKCLRMLEEHVEHLLIRLAAAIHEARTVADQDGAGNELQVLVQQTRQMHGMLKRVLAAMHPDKQHGAHDRLNAMGEAVDVLESQTGLH